MTEPTDKLAAGVPEREIRGDVGAAGGDVRHAGNLKIGGTIRHGMTVESGGELTVGGSIDGANVRAMKSITIAGNIVGRGEGNCVSGGAISFKIANRTCIEASDDIIAALEIVGCRIITGRAVRCEQGHIYGGHITANGGVVCGVLGSPAGTPMLVEVGIDERLRRMGKTRAAEVARNLRRIAKVRTEVAPLLDQQHALTPKQKETATEMLYDASELAEKTESLIRDMRRAVAAVQACSSSEVFIAKTLHCGVNIRFNGVQAQIGSDVKGPLKIATKPLGNTHQIVLVGSDNVVLQSLTTMPYDDLDLGALNTILNDRKLAA